MNYYYCSKCHAITKRESKAKKIKSICDATGKKVFITNIKNADELATKLRKAFLKNTFDLKSFKPKERIFLYMAFEQGAKVVFNRLR
jgi:thymidylate kinase